MHERLVAITDELRSASDRLRRLEDEVPAERWNARPSPAAWSAAECVAHLNLTSAAFVPVLRQALDDGEQLRGHAVRYRRDLLGWLLWRSMGPPVRMRTRTPAAFVPTAALPPAELTAEFHRLQADQIRLVEGADGLPLQKLKVRSPFDRRVSYNLYSAISILPRHQHRHLWQAELAWKER